MKCETADIKMQNVNSRVQNADIKMKNANTKMQKGKELGERFLDFAADNIELTVKLKRTASGRYMANQLMRAAHVSGANYEETQSVITAKGGQQ